MKLSRTYLALLAATALWCLVIVTPPAASHVPLLSRIACRVGATVCHRMESRSLRLGGVPLAVCARCTGIYVGFALAVLAAGVASFRPPRRPLAAWALVLAPMLADVALDALGIRHATLGSRLLTGAFFGAGAACILVPLLVEGAQELLRRRTRSPFSSHHELIAR